MEIERIVRRVRYSEIDKIPDLTWAEKEKFRSKRRPKRREELPLSLSALKAGDNREWGVFVEMVTPKLIHHVERLSDERFRQDIVSEAIINVYMSRYLYENVDHMIASLHEFARYEAFGRHWKRNSIRNTLLEGYPNPLLEWATYYDQRDAEDLETRAKYEEWKDQMVELIAANAIRLPRKWKIWVFLHLTGASRSEIWKFYKSETFHKTSQRLCHRKLRWIIDFELKEKRPDHEQQITDLREMLKGFPQRLADAVKAAMEATNLHDFAGRMNVHPMAASVRLKEVIEHINTVYYDAFLRYPLNAQNLRAFQGVTDPDFWLAIKDEILDSTIKRADNWEMHRKKFTKDELMDIRLMRQQKNMNWEAIARVLKSEAGKVKKAFQEAFPELPVDKKRKIRVVEVTNEQIAEIQRLHNRGEMTRAQIADRFSVSRWLVERIVTGRYTPAKRQLTMDQAMEIRRLYGTGDYTMNDLGSKFGVKRAFIERVIRNLTYKEGSAA